MTLFGMTTLKFFMPVLTALNAFTAEMLKLINGNSITDIV